MSNLINIYTDGSRKGKEPNFIGGWGTILEAAGQRKEMHGGELGASNNEMEMTAVIKGLRAVRVNDVDIKIFSDSAYVVNCFREKWYEAWKKNGWINSQKKPVENRKLWEEMLALVSKFNSVTFFHIDGHITLSKPEVVDAYHLAFNKKNEVNYNREEFLHIAGNNAAVDKLADRGAKEIM